MVDRTARPQDEKLIDENKIKDQKC